MTDRTRAQGFLDALDEVVELADDEVNAFLLNSVRAHPKDLVRVSAEKFGLSRQAIHHRVSELVRAGSVRAEGNTRNRTYTLGPMGKHALQLRVDEMLEEDRVWKTFCEPNCEGLGSNVIHLLSYGFTELLNNVHEHSLSQTVSLGFERTPTSIEMMVIDSGVGIFRKIRGAMGLDNDHQAVLELRKGKLTTDPAHHSGEGVFFSSRMFDEFFVASGTTTWMTGAEQDDFILDRVETSPGTRVLMSVAPDTRRTTVEVFAKYADADSDRGISRTLLALKLLEPEGPGLVSRSQAKRVLARLQEFERVTLDFKGVESVGPAFLDEIFRVFAKDNLKILLVPINVSPELRPLLERALRMAVAEGATQLAPVLSTFVGNEQIDSD